MQRALLGIQPRRAASLSAEWGPGGRGQKERCGVRCKQLVLAAVKTRTAHSAGRR